MFSLDWAFRFVPQQGYKRNNKKIPNFFPIRNLRFSKPSTSQYQNNLNLQGSRKKNNTLPHHHYFIIIINHRNRQSNSSSNMEKLWDARNKNGTSWVVLHRGIIVINKFLTLSPWRPNLSRQNEKLV